MGKPVPKWFKQGIPHLKMKEHIKEQSKKAKKRKVPKKNRKNKKKTIKYFLTNRKKSL
jgi:hypothetical protein